MLWMINPETVTEIYILTLKQLLNLIYKRQGFS